MTSLSLISWWRDVPFSPVCVSLSIRWWWVLLLMWLDDVRAMLVAILCDWVIQRIQRIVRMVDWHCRNRCSDRQHYAVTSFVRRNFRCLLMAIEQTMNLMMVTVGPGRYLPPRQLHDFVLHYWFQKFLQQLEMKHVLVVVLQSCLLCCHQRTLKQLNEWD